MLGVGGRNKKKTIKAENLQEWLHNLCDACLLKSVFPSHKGEMSSLI